MAVHDLGEAGGKSRPLQGNLRCSVSRQYLNGDRELDQYKKGNCSSSMYGSLHNLFPYAFSDAVGAGDGAKSFESLHFVLRLSLMETASGEYL
jgi:hypothetical protein